MSLKSMTFLFKDIRMFREAKQEHHSKYIVEAIESFWKWASVKINIGGNRVACTFYEIFLFPFFSHPPF